MPLRSWRLRIEDTLLAIERIREYVSGMDAEAFSRDQRTIDAVLRNLEIVGEAVHHVPDSVQERYLSIPWRDMRAMRNLLSHGYFLVDLAIVWKTVRDDLPRVAPELRRILDQEVD